MPLSHEEPDYVVVTVAVFPAHVRVMSLPSTVEFLLFSADSL